MKHRHGMTGTGKVMKLWGAGQLRNSQDVDTILKQWRMSLCVQPHQR
jgi:hypothetical protein